MGHGAHPLGLTVSTFTTDGHSQTEMRQIPQGWCAYARRIVLRIGFVSHQVYVDRRFRPDSCMYRAVLDHEHEHVRIGRAALAQHAGEIRRALELFLHDNPVFLVSDQAAGRQVFLDGLNRVLAPLLAEMDAEARAGHARLDAPESLERTRRACPSWSSSNGRGNDQIAVALAR